MSNSRPAALPPAIGFHSKLLLPGNEPYRDIHRLVFVVNSLMNFDVPRHGGRHETGCLLQKLLVILAVIRFAFAQLPGGLEVSLSLRVQPNDFELAHFELVAFEHVQVVVNRAVLVIQQRLRCDACGHVALRVIQLRHFLKITDETHSVSRLAGRKVDLALQVLSPEHGVALPIVARTGVDLSRRQWQDRIHLHLAARLRHHAGLGICKRRLQVSALQTNRHEVNLCDLCQRRSYVGSSAEFAGRRLQGWKLIGGRPGELDVTNSYLYSFCAVRAPNDFSTLLGTLAEIVYTRRNFIFVQNRLQRFFYVVREYSFERDLPPEQGGTPLNHREQLGVRKPDEVFKVRRNQLALFHVGELKFELGSVGRERERVGNVCKQARVAQAPGRFLEIRFGDVLA